MDFRFTRHILSCNNLDQGKFKGKDTEPGLTISGIIDSANFESENFKSYDVCVSNLYRTWCTAVVLYGRNKDDILNLWVCPYLKEKFVQKLGYSIQRGNFPKSIQHMANKFLKFLTFLNDIKTFKDDELIKPIYKNYDNWYDNLPNEILVRFPINEQTKYSNYTKVENNIIYKKSRWYLYYYKKLCR